MGAGTGSLQTALIFCYWVLQKKDRYSSVFWNWSMGKINWSYQR